MTTPNTSPEITLSCEVCGEEITGPERGRMNAAMKLGTHRWVKHQIKGAGKARAGDVDERSLDDQPAPISIVRSISDGVGRGGKRAPNADELARGLGRGISLSSVFAASLILDSDEELDDAQREEWVQALSIEPAAATDLMRPIGRAASGTKLNDKVGRKVVDNVDVLSSVFELGLITQQWRRYFALRAARHAPAPAPSGAQWHPDGVFGPTPPAYDESLLTPPPQAGIVLSAEDVQRMQRANGAG